MNLEQVKKWYLAGELSRYAAIGWIEGRSTLDNGLATVREWDKEMSPDVVSPPPYFERFGND